MLSTLRLEVLISTLPQNTWLPTFVDRPGQPCDSTLACPSVRECLLKSDAFRLTIGEVDGEEPVRAIETL